MKKILILTQHYKMGGLETNLKTTLNFLKSKGYELYLVTSQDSILVEIEHLLDKKLLIDMEIMIRNEVESVRLIREFINSNQISLAILHPFSTYQLGSVASQLEGIPYFIVVHGPININKNDTKSYLFNRFFTFPNAHTIFTVSEELSKLIFEHYHIKSKVLYNPIDIEKSLGENSTLPKDYIYISRLDEDKLNGLKEAIKFVYFYNQRNDLKKLIIIGDGNKKEELVKWVQENFKDSSWLEFVGYKSNVNYYINDAQIVFGMGRVVLEALSLGKDVVLTGYDGLKGIVNTNNLEKFMFSNFSGRGLKNLEFEELYEQVQNLKIKKGNADLKEIINDTFSIEKIGNVLIEEIKNINYDSNKAIFNDSSILEELVIYLKYFLNSEVNLNLFEYYLSNIDLVNSKDNPLMKELLFEMKSKYNNLAGIVTEKENDNNWYRVELEKSKEEINWFKSTLETNNAILKGLTDSYHEKDKVISDLIQNKKELLEEITEFEKRIAYFNNVNYELNHQLTNFQNTKAWKILNKYYRLMELRKKLKNKIEKFNYIVKTRGLKEAISRSTIYIKSHKESPLPNNSSQLINLYSNLKNDYNVGKIKGLAIIPSAFEFDELYNQRTINFAKYLAKEGYAVLYVAWQWGKEEKLEKNYQTFLNNIHQVPLYDFLETNFNLIKDINNKKFIITFPAQEFSDLIVKFKENAFIIIYDIMDEWEEFYNQGESPWYKIEIEEAIILNSDAIFAVSDPLRMKFNYLRNDIKVVGNGYSEDVSKNRNISLKKPATDNKIHIGYFGHMTAAWFNWELIFELAKEDNIFIHLIGYGADDKTLKKINKYNNINYYGKIHPRKLHEIVNKWHIGIIPFKHSKLSEAVDPIKVYEYLYFGLPTVSSGIPHLNTYPLVINSETANHFYGEITKLYQNIINGGIDNSTVNEFLLNSTWDSRFKSIMEYIEKNNSFQLLFKVENEVY